MKNIYGNRLGNCGYDGKLRKFIPCEIENVQCGMLHCYRFDSKRKFGLSGQTDIVYSMIYHGSGVIPCHSIILRRAVKDFRPIMVADGELQFDY